MTPSSTILTDLLTDRPLGDKRVAVAADSDDRGITFPTFLTLMGEHLCDFDTEAELLGAFECFDEGDTGVVKVDEMRKWLVDVGERMDQREVRTREHRRSCLGCGGVARERMLTSVRVCRLTSY